MKVADAIARYLSDKGIQHAFGIIGAGNAALFDAIARHAKTELVPVHHEQSAVSAAAFYARTARRVGVAIVTTGAGSANAITGALAALMDSVPVLIISGNEPSRYLKHDGRVIGVQGFHTGSAVAPFTKATATAGDAMFTVLQELDMAYKATTDRRHGPVWLDIPRDHFNAMV